MRLQTDQLKNRQMWEKAGISLPDYDVEAVRAKALDDPKWVHFGIGNIFRIFIGEIAQDLLEKGGLDRGLTCVETFDYEVVDKIYKPYDNLSLSVILKSDGTRENRLIGAFAEAVKADCTSDPDWKRMKEIFCSKDLQMVSFTITEKGYALRRTDGRWLAEVEKDLEAGPKQGNHAMTILTAMLLERFLTGRQPLALVSMDNCAQNGTLLRNAVLTIAGEWEKRGFTVPAFTEWLSDETQVSFPWTMIDKITPRPSETLAEELEEAGIEDMHPVITTKRTYIAPFVNAEKPQYLVIEDRFPNGRPQLEKGFGVYMADRETVRKSERMKVTACLNPVHSALGPLEVVLGIDLFADGLKDPVLMKMGRMVAYLEGMPVIEDPGILSPRAFTDELFHDRFVNEYLGDTNLRLSTDVSQGVGVRFGETIKAYKKKYGTAESLTAIPLGIAGWLRYMMAVDDKGESYELAPDPMNEELTERLKTVKLGHPESLTDQLEPVLSNESVFFTNLYTAGLGKKIEQMFREMIAGPGAARRTLDKYIGTKKEAGERLQRQLDFILEIDKEKNIFRQTHLSGKGRNENDAEHAWHMAIMAYLLKEYSNEPVDISKVMLMCLIHDVVEIDAGDTYAYDAAGLKTQKEREERAKERIYSLLPDDQREILSGIFDEFEAYRTPEAKFAHAMDNLQPLLLNDSNDGGDWVEHKVDAQKVYGRQAMTRLGSEKLFEITDAILEKNIASGAIRPF